MMPYPSNEARLAWERSPEPGWIDSPEGPLFSWYHAPHGPARDVAILLVETIGSERMNVHLTYRHLALRLSHAGFPVLRFDYAGTADSSGFDRNVDRVAVWESGLRCAAEALRRRSGIERLSLFGMRLGGTLCIRHALQDPGIADMVLWGPYQSGRAFLRGERALDRLAAANVSGKKASDAEDGDVECLGFLYTADTVASLGAIDLRTLEQSPCRAARIFAWDAYSPEDDLAARISTTGCEVEFTRDSRIDSDAACRQQRVPEVLLEETTSWLVDRHPLLNPDERTEGDDTPFPRTAIIRRSRTDPSSIREDAVYFGPHGDLFGIHSKPSLELVESTSKRLPSLILVNGGNNHRAGINRNYTEWARDAAALGAHVMRMDIHGLGDSPALEPGDLNVLYRRETVDDVVAAIDFMTEAEPDRPIVVCGLCAGAFQTLHTTLRDERVRGMILIDILRWEFDRVSKRRKKGFVARRLQQIEKAIKGLRQWSVRVGILRDRREPNMLGESLWTLVSRGVEVKLIATSDGKGYEPLREALDHRRSDLEASGHFTLDVLADTNHIFSPLWAQEWLRDFLLATLQDMQSIGVAVPASPGVVSMRDSARSAVVEDEPSRTKEGR